MALACSSGYGCNDHFFEADTYTHSIEVWPECLTTRTNSDCFMLHFTSVHQVLAKLLEDAELRDIIVDVGMYVRDALGSAVS